MYDFKEDIKNENNDKKIESNDMRFIRGFASISIASICREKRIDKSNMYKLYNLPKQRENAKIVRNELEKRLLNLLSEVKNGDDEVGE